MLVVVRARMLNMCGWTQNLETTLVKGKCKARGGSWIKSGCDLQCELGGCRKPLAVVGQQTTHDPVK